MRRTWARRPDGGWAAAASLWLLVLAPLAWLPGGFERFVVAKLLVVGVAVLAAALARRRGVLPRAVLVAGAVAAVVLVVASCAGATPFASLAGRYPRYEGLPTLAVYAGAGWAGSRVLGPGGVGRLTLPLSVSSVLLAAASVLDVAGVRLTGVGAGPGRDGSLLGNASDQGAVGLMGALVLLGVVLRWAEDRWLAVVGAVAALVTVGCSGSRAAIVLAAVGLAVLAAAGARSRGRGPGGRALVVPTAGLVVLAAAVLVVPTTRHRLVGTVTARGRLEQWGLTSRLVRDHWWLGVGPSRYLDVFPRYESARFVRFTGPATLADSPHSVVLQVLVAGGVPLLLAVVAAAVVVVRRGVRAVRADAVLLAPALAVAAYVVTLGVTFTTAGPTCLAAMLLGAVLTQAPPIEQESPRRRGCATVAAGLAVVLLVGACVGDVRLRQGVTAIDHGRIAAGVHDVDSARGWQPWDVDVPMLAAQALAQSATDGYASAGGPCLRQARASLAHTADNATTEVARGVCLLARGYPQQALGALDAAVVDAPHRPDAYVARALARLDLHDRAGARADLARAAAIEPRSPVVRRLQRRVR